VKTTLWIYGDFEVLDEERLKETAERYKNDLIRDQKSSNKKNIYKKKTSKIIQNTRSKKNQNSKHGKKKNRKSKFTEDRPILPPRFPDHPKLVFFINDYVYNNQVKKYGKFVSKVENGLIIEYSDSTSEVITPQIARTILWRVPSNNIYLMHAYSKNEKIREFFLKDDLDEVRLAIIATVKRITNYQRLKLVLVPTILSYHEWDMWELRFLRKFNIINSEKYITHEEHEQTIKPQDFVIKVSNLNCIVAGHLLESIQAKTYIYSNDQASIEEIRIPAGYCPKCRRYYVLSTIFSSHLNQRKLLCDVVNIQNLSNYLKSRTTVSANLAKESIIRRCGYSVDTSKGLSDSDRLNILLWIIQSNILSEEEVKSFLNWLIHFNINNRHQEEAIRKWKRDLLLLKTNRDARVVNIKRIIIKRSY
jgi:hypothetical protein